MPDGMTRTRTTGEPVADHGPRIQHKLKRLEVVDAADPTNPNRTIRRARVVCHYDTAWRKGQISDAEREAADRYAQTYERADGARERHDGPTSMSRAWERTPPLTQLQASASITMAHQAVGNDAAGLLRDYVIRNLTAEQIAEKRREDRKLTMGRIRATLCRLAEHWGMA